MKIKHSKYKNTAILYETLIKNLIQETINGNSSISIDIIKKYFGKGTELNKELTLYKYLLENKFDTEYKAGIYVDKIIESHKKIDSNKLRKQKYNLVKEIKENYNIEDFFTSKISNYKSYASAYKVFTYDESDNVDEITKCKFQLSENMTNVSQKEEVQDDLAIYRSQDKDIRNQAYKILVESFNQKYSILKDNQKNLLREYIQNENGNEVKDYVLKTAKGISEELKRYKKSSKINEVMKTKLNEVGNLLCKFKNIKLVNENNIYSLLKYYDLLDELKKIEDN